MHAHHKREPNVQPNVRQTCCQDQQPAVKEEVRMAGHIPCLRVDGQIKEATPTSKSAGQENRCWRTAHKTSGESQPQRHLVSKKQRATVLEKSMAAIVIGKWTRCCTVLHVMIFIVVQKPRTSENHLHVMIAIAIGIWTRCCAMLHVMIHVLALLAIQNTTNHNVISLN